MGLILSDLLPDTLQLIPIQGAEALSETLVFDQRTHTLVVSDLLFQMKDPMPLGRRLILTLAGARNRIAQSRLVKALIKDRDKYHRSLTLLKSLKIEQIIISHGANLTTPADIQVAMNILGLQ